MRYRCKNQVKELLDKEVVDLYGHSNEDNKNLTPGMKYENSPKNTVVPSVFNRNSNRGKFILFLYMRGSLQGFPDYFSKEIIIIKVE